jgi:hypothetical protein
MPIRAVGCSSLILLAAGCGGEPETAMSHTVRDSAGIRIVESTSASWGPDDQWTIAASPSLDLGVVEGAVEYEFQYVAGATRIVDGNIVVANSGSGELRCFDSDGNHLWTTGRRGEGPGEFRNLGWVQMLGSDSIVAYDRSLRRISVFDLNGALGRTTNIEAPGGLSRPTALGVLDDGTILVQANAYVTPNTVSEGLNPVDGWLLSYTRQGERGDTIASAPPISWFAYSSGPRRVIAPQPFSHESVAAIGRSRIHLGHTSAFEIGSYHATGGLERLVRVLQPNRPVTSDDIQTYERLRLEQEADAGERSALRDQVEVAPFPETFPAFASLMVDDAGRLWVENYRLPGESDVVYSVFGDEGELLGAVRVPLGLRIYEIGNDYVLGRWRDELDVEHIRLHELVKP